MCRPTGFPRDGLEPDGKPSGSLHPSERVWRHKLLALDAGGLASTLGRTGGTAIIGERLT
jgi:hypothetical protein